jgi:glycosyltransferase involved in cell wall biosynthesis
MQELAAARGIRADVLPFGVALDRWPPAPVRPRVGGAPARLLQIADLNPVKDQTTLLEAAARLRAAGRAFHLDIVGADTLGGAVQRRTASLGLGDEITFHGFLPHRSLRPIVEGADLLIVSSRHEADPTVLLEAAVAGVPTVGTAVGHIRDWAPEAAVAVPVGDSEALAAAIQDVLADEARRRRLAEAAQRRAVVRDADWTARRVTEIYRELCNV